MAKIQLKRSAILNGSTAQEPTSAQMEYGELAINYNEGDPSIFLKDSNNNIVRIAGTNSKGNVTSDIEGYPTLTDGEGATLDNRYLKLGATVGAQVVQSSSPTDFNGGLKVSGGSTNLLELAHTGTTKLVVLANGNVGIGELSPTAPLHVSGSVVAGSFTGTGTLLTSINATNISQGTLDTARMPSTYTLASQLIIEATGTSNQLRLKAAESLTIQSGVSELGFIQFIGNDTNDSYRFSKAGQSTITGNLSFENLTADRVYSFPDEAGTLVLTTTTVGNSSQLGGFGSTSFIRSDADTAVTANTTWGDDYKAVFGTDGDLSIRHDDTLGIIDNNKGDLKIRNNVDGDDGGNVIIQAKSGENSAIFNDNGSVQLYFDNVEKFKTITTGSQTLGIHEATQLKSTATSGTTPFIVASNTLVSNLNADTVDGVEASSFLRSDADTTFNASGNNFNFNSDGNRELVGFQYNGTDMWILDQNNNGIDLDFDKQGSHSGVIKIDGNLVWHAGNDGSGSGLDADTLDGFQSTNFINSSIVNTITNSFIFNDNVEQKFGTSSDFSIFHESASNDHILKNNRQSDGDIKIQGVTTGGVNQDIIVASSSSARSYAELYENNDLRLNTTSTGVTVTGVLTGSVGIASPYVQITNGGQLQDVAGEYGSINVTGGDTSSYGGYAIEDSAIFMRNSTSGIFGLYDDVNNHWAVEHTPNGSTQLYYDGTARLYTTLTGARVNAELIVDGDLVPDTDNTGNVGTSLKTWNNGRFTDLTIENELSLGSSSNTKFVNDGSNLTLKCNNNHDVKFTDVNSSNAERFYFDISEGKFSSSGNADAGVTQPSPSNSGDNDYEDGIHAISVYGRNSSSHSVSDNWSAKVLLKADYQGPGNDATNKLGAMIYAAQVNSSNSELPLHNMDVTGDAFHYGNIYAGRSKTDQDNLVSYSTSDSEVMIQALDDSGTNFTMIQARNTDDTASVFEAKVSSTLKIRFQADGNGRFDGGADIGFADYAEMFEWKDGNPNNEDRRGYAVCLDGDLIRIATSEDNPAELLGIISAEPGILGDSASLNWHGAYLRDDYGRRLRNNVEYLIWNELGEDAPDPNNSNDQEAHRLKVSELGTGSPADLAVPVYAREANIRKTYYELVENPNYDSSQNYVSRRDRKEWDPVGMLGKLALRKGEPVGDRWRKLKSINDNLDLWLVR